MEKKNFEPYVYHSPATHKKGIRVTVAGKVQDGYLNIAVSRCGEEDKFVKKEGLKIAIERLNKGVLFTKVEFENKKLSNFIEIAKLISETVIKHSTYTFVETIKEEVISYKYSVKVISSKITSKN